MTNTKNTTIIRTNKVIMYLWDLEKKEPRRVIFGDPEELYEFFVDQSAYLHQRLRKISSEKYKNKEKLKEAIVESREGFERENAADAFTDNSVIEISYKIVKK